MSSFAGIITYKSAPRSSRDRRKHVLRTMQETGRWRAPECGGMHETEDIGVAQSLLCINPEDEYDPLPLVSADCLLCWDGRIDNRPELLQQLNNDQKSKLSDAALVLRGYQEWGSNVADHLAGDFAFTIWDEKQKMLFMARDFLGSRPLFYSVLPHEFVFASSIRQILCFPDVSKTLLRRYLLNFLIYPTSNCLQVGITPYKEVRRLPPGFCAEIRLDGSVRQWRYWHIDRILLSCPQSMEECAEQFLVLLRAAVKSMLRCTGGIMMDLSGGLDSSAIVAIAASESPPLPLFTCSHIHEKWADADERSYQKALLRRYPLPNAAIPSDDLWMLKNALQDAPCPDEPFGGYVAYHQNLARVQSAVNYGARCLLSGIGGNEGCEAEPYTLLDSLRIGDLRELFLGVRHVAAQQNGGYFKAILKYLCLPVLPVSMHGAMLSNLTRLTEAYEIKPTPPEPPTWVNAALLRASGGTEALWQELPENHSRYVGRRMILKDYYEANSMPWFNDYAAMPNGIEARSPFHYKPLVEFLCAVPLSLKLSCYQGEIIDRCFMRHALRDLLPHEIAFRTENASFSSHMLAGLQHEHALYASEFLLVKHDFVLQDVISAQLGRWRNGLWEFPEQMRNFFAAELWLRSLDRSDELEFV